MDSTQRTARARGRDPDPTRPGGVDLGIGSPRRNLGDTGRPRPRHGNAGHISVGRYLRIPTVAGQLGGELLEATEIDGNPEFVGWLAATRHAADGVALFQHSARRLGLG
jgi:hypothetical protein